MAVAMLAAGRLDRGSPHPRVVFRGHCAVEAVGEMVQEPAAYQRAGFLPRVGVDLGEIVRTDRPQRRASSKLSDIEFLVHYVDSRR